MKRDGKYLKSIVYGGLDGIITTFAIVAGVAGASLSSSIVMILGFANLIADGFSMAVGDYLSTKAELEISKSKKSPIKNGVVTFLSFIIFGLIPLLSYLADFAFEIKFNVFLISILLTIFALFLLGIAKYKITGKHWVISSIETVLIGGVAAAIAYFVGYLVSAIV